MRRKRRLQPELETLESMTLLSSLAPWSHHAAAVAKVDGAPPVFATPTTVSLNGTLKGTYHFKSSLPDVGADYTFFGNGKVKPVGRAAMTGHLQLPGNVAKGRAEGLVVISTPAGSLTLRLEGPEQKGFASPPDRLAFKITNASGRYLKDRGEGTLILVLDPVKAGADHGTFTMVLVSSVAPKA